MLGSTVNVPTVAEGAIALQGSAPQAAGLRPPRPAAPAQGAPAVLGSYVVRQGDTLSGLAANAGVATEQMAAANGLDPTAPLLIGTVLKLPSGAPTPVRASEPLPSQRVVPAHGPEPTPTRVGAGDIQSVASQYGVSPSLAAAIAWQESGFNNGMVSSANARGVMQVMPGTWDYVEQNLAGRKLDTSSATDNVHAGVLYLQHLLRADRRRRERRDRRLLPGPRLGPVARPVRRHAEVRRERAGPALALRGLIEAAPPRRRVRR